ncbi:UPF0223 family protein [Sporosarcina sp. HYO08]|uniref:UPF0223 family protein n=1 Tax=Sporosarcina sp. HYO08 TaxID=1759557 RepID=UPI000791C1AB|nr:UPF0223 family protein [Sporosarcina sp. HYO08]KXH79854.1 hypothetical protein AU377_10255 [Sporosarcina sp. HYO08]
MEYNYPLRYDWSTDEMIQVVSFFEAVEKAYESSVERNQLMDAYRNFKKVVPSMAEEKTLFKEFEQVSGYGSYPVVKAAKAGKDGDRIQGVQR